MQHRRQRTFAELLTRSLAGAGVVYALVIAYAVSASVLAGLPGSPGSRGEGASALSRTTGDPVWKKAHAERFPGCVDMARWRSPDVPSTVVVVRLRGHAQRMAFDEAFRRATSVSPADDVWTIGACG